MLNPGSNSLVCWGGFDDSGDVFKENDAAFIPKAAIL